MQTHEDVIKEYFKQDRLAALLGIELTGVTHGGAHAHMTIRPDHYNGLGTVHGGSLFSLADFTFAAAANSHGNVSVAINTSMSFVKAVSAGVLYAEARQMSHSPRLSTYEVVIKDDVGDTVGIFQGMAYNKKEKIADRMAEKT